MAGREDVGKARFLTEVDASGVDKGLDDATRKIKQTGKATEDAFARQGTQAVGRFRAALDGMLAKAGRFQQGGGITGALMGGIGLGAGLGAFGLVTNALGGVVSGMGDAIAAASDLAESQGKVEVVFGRSAGAIERWSDTAATEMGLSKQAALEAAGTFGNLFDAIGLAEDATLDMSKGATQLAADLAAFNNVGTEETLLAIRSGLLGEAEPMRKFGSALSEARVQAFGLENGIGEMVRTGKTVKFVMSDAQKMTARYRLILQDTANAAGNFKDTSDGLAGSQKVNAARAADLQARVGGLVAPLGTALVGAGGAAFDAIDTLTGAFHELWRVMDPNQAVIEDTEKLIREMAEEYGFAADDVIAFMRVQEASRRATDERTASLELAAEWERKFQDEVLDSTGAMADGIVTAQEQLAINEQVYRLMEESGFVIDEATGRWIEYDRRMAATQATTENARKVFASFLGAEGIKALVTGGGKLVDFWVGLGEAASGAGRVATSAATDFSKAAKAVPNDLVAFDEGAIEARFDSVTKKVGKKMRTLRVVGFNRPLGEIKDDVELGLAEIQWALEHPMVGSRMEETYKTAIEDGTAAMRKALKTGNTKAYAEASEFVRKYKAKLRELRQQTFQVNVAMFVDTSGVTGIGATLLGGLGGAVGGTKGHGYRPPGHWGGLPYVPYDNYPALLHQGERVLTARENREATTRTVTHTGTVEVRLSRDTIANARAAGASWDDIGRMARIASPSDGMRRYEDAF